MIALDKIWRFGLAWLATPPAKFFALNRQDGVWDFPSDPERQAEWLALPELDTIMLGSVDGWYSASAYRKPICGNRPRSWRVADETKLSIYPHPDQTKVVCPRAQRDGFA